MERYRIEHKGIKEGTHRFSFDVSKALFAQADYSEVLDCSCKVDIHLMSYDTILKAEVKISGTVTVECDRCLEPCAVEVEYTAPLLIKICESIEPWQSEESEAGEVMWLSAADEALDLTQYIYESIILALPYQRVHRRGGCSAEMAQRFKIVSQEQFDEIEQSTQSGGIDPEGLSALAALKEKMKTLTKK